MIKVDTSYQNTLYAESCRHFVGHDQNIDVTQDAFSLSYRINLVARAIFLGVSFLAISTLTPLMIV